MEAPYRSFQDSPPASWRSHYSFLCVFYLNVLLACTSFSIVLPSIWPYIQKHGGTDEFLAAVLFIYSFGELIGSIVFGYIYSICSAKNSFTVCVVIGMVGSAMYVAADYFEGDLSLWLIFTGRLLQGLWTGGNQSIEAAYISEVVEPDFKLGALSDMGMCAVLGFLLGPILGYLLSFVDFEISAYLRIDQFTGPGYFIMAANAVMVLVFVFTFKEISRRTRESMMQAANLDSVQPNSIGVYVCYFISFVAFSGFAVQETITTPLVTDIDRVYTDSFDWTVNEAYLLYGSSSIASIFAFIFLNKTSGKFDDRVLLYYSLFLGLLGWLLFVDWVPRQINILLFLIGYTLVGLAYPLNRCVIVNLLSNIIGPNPAGRYMGWIIATGGLARCVGPFLSIYTLKASPRVCFGTTAGLFLLAIVVLHVTWKSCTAHPNNKKTE